MSCEYRVDLYWNMPEDIFHNNGSNFGIHTENRRFRYNEVKSHIMINEWFQHLIDQME